MSLHRITTSEEDKLIKLNNLFTEAELQDLELTGYAYYYKFNHYLLIIPCSVIFETYYASRVPLLKATLNGDLKSIYYKFKYSKRHNKIDIHVRTQFSDKVIALVCQLLIDKRVEKKFQYIFFQKVNNNNKLDYSQVRCFFPYFGEFNLECHSSEFIHSKYGEVCIVRNIKNKSFLNMYGLKSINIHYKKYSTTMYNDYFPVIDLKLNSDIDLFLEQYRYFNYFTLMISNNFKQVFKNLSIIQEYKINNRHKLEISLSHTEYKEYLIVFMFIINDRKLKSNFFSFYVDKNFTYIEDHIIQFLKLHKQKGLEEICILLKERYKTYETRIPKYHISDYQQKILINEIIKTCL